jgi:hypothetical protein
LKRLLAAVLTLMLSLPVLADVNLRVSPLGFLIGSVGVSLDVPVSQQWTLGPDVGFMAYSDGVHDITGLKLGIRGNYWFGRDVFTQGWYMGPALNYSRATVKRDDELAKLDGEGTAITASVIFGYQWMWDSFNINLGIGPSFTSAGTITITDDSGQRSQYSGLQGTGLTGEFTFGWRF